MPDISGMLNIYIYVLFGSLLFVAVLGVTRAIGGDVLHHDVMLDHAAEIGTAGGASHVEIGSHTPDASGAEATGPVSITQVGLEPSANPQEGPGMVKFQGMTLMTISIFLVGFSAMGILSLYYVSRPYNLDPLTSIPVAGVTSAALALGLSYLAFKYFIATAAGSEMSLREAVGRTCEVTVGTSGEGLGEVNCSVKGQILSFPARSLDGSRLNVGDGALIVRMTGNIAVVQKRPNL